MTTHDRPVLLDAAPVAVAIGVFGVIYGAMATAVMEPRLAVASSLLMFSGAAQFATVGLLSAGTTTLGLLAAVALLGLRHIPLAALVRPHLDVPPTRRALLALALTDETAGLTVASSRPATRTLAIVGACAYSAFAIGTVAGVLGADLLGLAPLAGIVFVVLFIGLASLTSRSRADTSTAVIAAGATAVLALLFPAAGTAGAILVAIAATAIRTGARS